MDFGKQAASIRYGRRMIALLLLAFCMILSVFWIPAYADDALAGFGAPEQTETEC